MAAVLIHSECAGKFTGNEYVHSKAAFFLIQPSFACISSPTAIDGSEKRLLVRRKDGKNGKYMPSFPKCRIRIIM